MTEEQIHQRAADDGWMQKQQQRIAELESDNARLREALSQIAKEKRPEEYDHREYQVADFEGLFECAVSIARAALANTGGKEGA